MVARFIFLIKRKNNSLASGLCFDCVTLKDFVILCLMSETLFTKIIKREIPSTIIHEDDDCIAIADIHPQSKAHYLIIPKKQIARLAEASLDDQPLLGHLLLTAQKVAREQGLNEGGYRIVINSGPNAGETVPHLHVHVLGGERLQDSFGA